MNLSFDQIPRVTTGRRCLSLTLLAVAGWLANMPAWASADAHGLFDACRQSVEGHVLVPSVTVDANWKRHAELRTGGDHVDGSIHHRAGGDVQAAVLRVQSHGPQGWRVASFTISLDEEPNSIVGRLTLNQAGQSPDWLLSVATAAGMYQVSTWLYTLAPTSASPMRIELAPGALPQPGSSALVRLLSDLHAPGSAGRAFVNPSIRCEQGKPLLVESWSSVSERGIACWRLLANGRVAPMVAYRELEVLGHEVAGWREARIAGVQVTRAGRRVVTKPKVRALMDVAAPTCQQMAELLGPA